MIDLLLLFMQGVNFVLLLSLVFVFCLVSFLGAFSTDQT